MKKLIALSLVVFICCGFGYQHYRKDACENCHRKPSLISFVFLAVHHSIPQHICKQMHREDLINDPNNLITLCDSYVGRTNYCHWKIGHGGKSWDYDNHEITDVMFHKNGK